MVIDTLVFIITLWGTKAAGPRSPGPVSSYVVRLLVATHPLKGELL